MPSFALGAAVKHLIVCCDGTWNSPHDETNVRRLYDAVADQNADGEQKKCYVSGIGTTGFLPVDVVAGAVGLGLDSKMVEAYDFLARNYQHENTDGRPDKISLVGFSRGAYLARNLAGMLTTYGLEPVPPGTGEADRTLAENVYDAYHHNTDSATVWRRWFHRRFAHPVQVHFLGVWDTVGSLGIPAEFAILDTLDASKYRFYNTRLSDRVVHARHAVALDERRGPFAPTLWTSRADARGSTFRQIWFPGNHGSVGGCSREQVSGAGAGHLSDVTLRWMVDQAAECGIAFGPMQLTPDSSGDFAENLRSFYRYVNPHPRAVPQLAENNHDTTRGEIHESALQRVKVVEHYRPQTELIGDPPQAEASVMACEPWNDTGIWLTPGTYQLSARGEWSDSGVRSGPSGTRTAGSRFPAALLRGGMRALEVLQVGIRAATRNDQARVFGTRRVCTDSTGNATPWMCLVGVIADGALDPRTELQQPHTTFKIGDGITDFEVFRPGYLYAFANDAWGFYFNNAGAVELTVRSDSGPSGTPRGSERA